MVALSMAERIVATTPGTPYDADVLPREVRVFLHRQPEAVAEFASVFGVQLALRTEHGGKDVPYLEARGVVGGIAVSAWALGGEDEQERYAACLSVAPAAGVAELPEAWRAAGAA